jgi:GrpB-like predicted nucleotidyltransferase (UPF0157 family)
MVIEQYNPDWIIQFEQIKNELQRNIKTYNQIHHIGSTSIPGMYAKPIIDINIELKDIPAFGKIKGELENAGYYHNGNQGIAGREVFKRKNECHNEILDSIRHHLYVCATDATEHVRNILFRDYLRNHSEYVKRYNEIKWKILKEYGEDNREKYVEVKEKNYRWFFEEVLKKATE